MRIVLSELRRIIKEEINRCLVENNATPEVRAANGKIQVTISDEMFDFNTDDVENLVKGRGTIYSDGYDHDKETGCMMMRDNRSSPVKVSVHEDGKSTATDVLDANDLNTALETLL